MYNVDHDGVHGNYYNGKSCFFKNSFFFYLTIFEIDWNHCTYTAMLEKNNV